MQEFRFNTKEELDAEVKALTAKGWKVTGPHVAPKYEGITVFYASKEAADDEKVEGAQLGKRDIKLTLTKPKEDAPVTTTAGK